MAAVLTLRVPTGSPLTNQQVDDNFTALNTYGNTINSNVGVLSNLTTSSTANIVAAINTIKGGNLSIFAATTSAQLAGVMSDETGTGNLVFSSSPTITSPAFSGTSTGTYTLGGTLTIASPAFSGSSTGTYTLGGTLTVAAHTLSGTISGGGNQINNVILGASTPLAGTFTTLNFTGTTAQTLTDNVTVNWDTSAGSVATLTLGGIRTVAAPTNLGIKTYILTVNQDATGSRLITWNSVFKWAAGSAPVLSTAANAKDIFSFFSDGTNLYGSFLRGVA
jgi:hypothetical protein